ncbi:hypothetical protein J7337_003489 [Fusarium musae]|uniref:Enoyl reductase (ER) domain-containing protein n=1 Tax=Fusarium musae TaxID=1042133 RepID=A0A9P8DKH5_9HYPO|nr:hypothetical protein J7337_003489 [Fusarium musae]KAG9503538.1 hypothetical protein J7337_003489 [Fusarium musae]
MALPKITRRWVLPSLDGPSSLKLESIELVPPGPNQIVVKIPLPLPYVPLSDGAGVVAAVGERVKNLRPGDKVFSVFKPAWRSGRQRREFGVSNLAGSDVQGILSEYVMLDEEYWTPVPRNLTFVEASTLTVAGVTAWNALYGLSDHQLRPGQSVLTEGTGGAMKTVKSDGLVTIVGFIAGLAEQQPSIVDMFFSMATFRSVHCGSLEHYSQMIAAIEQHDIKPHVDRIFGFEDVPAAYKYMSEQNFIGKICISVE